MKILVTGSAGFIGFHVAQHLLKRGDEVTGLDSINDYYDTGLKYGRLQQAGIAQDRIRYGEPVRSTGSAGYRFLQLKLEDREAIEQLFRESKFDCVCHLAAQAGVRYSLINPAAYMDSNITGFLNILEACRHSPVRHLAYASSSSVYGLNKSMPFSTSQCVDHPASLYAASKKANELMAHTYSHLFHIPVTGLRFFTVYGPWGRPDMALFLFTRAILEDRPIDVYNHGAMRRDFTYIDDIVEGVVRIIDRPPKAALNGGDTAADPGSSPAPYKIYNIGNSSPVRLLDFIEALEQELGKKARKNMLPLQPGDVEATWADVDDLMADTGYRPATPIASGIKRFVAWYKDFYGTAQ